jgi:NAD(P)-dependent dehydrogenase (short-subunit alcohol dehydrogenase family)
VNGVGNDRAGHDPLRGPRRPSERRPGRATVWESADAAVYLLADESRFMTGQQIRLDGGATLVR